MISSKYSFLFIVSALTLTCCRTVKDSDFNVKSTISSTLPKMEGDISLKSLKENISLGDIKLSGYYNGSIKIKPNNKDTINDVLFTDENLKYVKIITSESKIIIEDHKVDLRKVRDHREDFSTKGVFIPEARVNDIIRQLNYELTDKTTITDSLFKGKITFELKSFHEKRNSGLSILCAWSLGILPLIGVPFTCVKTEMSPKICIYNQNGTLIKEYEANGKGKAYMAMYWGYGKDTWRKSSLNALQNAMDKIKTQINSDKVSLLEEL